jgi:hypothetical protein
MNVRPSPRFLQTYICVMLTAVTAILGAMLVMQLTRGRKPQAVYVRNESLPVQIQTDDPVQVEITDVDPTVTMDVDVSNTPLDVQVTQ